MSGEGRKDDQEKPRWDLLPLRATAAIVDVLTFGAKKYGANNWQLVDDHEDRYTAALMRHVIAWRLGERDDEESELHHLAHAGCCLLFLLSQELGHDRVTIEPEHDHELFGLPVIIEDTPLTRAHGWYISRRPNMED